MLTWGLQKPPWGWSSGQAWSLGQKMEPSHPDEAAPSLLGEFLNELKASTHEIFLRPHSSQHDSQEPNVETTQVSIDVGG